MKQKQASRPNIDLAGRQIVASGAKRDIYLLRDNDTAHDGSGVMVLKVPRYAELARKRTRGKRLTAKLFPKSRMRTISKEANYWRRLCKRNPEAKYAIPLPAFYGIVDTSAGPGALWQAICDKNGQMAPTLNRLARQNLTPSSSSRSTTS